MWLKIKKSHIEESTYGLYQNIIDRVLIPYFEPMNLTLDEVTPLIIQCFIVDCSEERKVSPSTIKKYYTCINQTLNMAFRFDLILSNPCLKVIIPRIEKGFKGDILTFEELNKVLECSKNSLYEETLFMAIIYGLRRSEVLGLKWSSVNFESKTFTIENKVVSIKENNKTKVICKKGAKNKKSFRTFPFVNGVEELLLI